MIYYWTDVRNIFVKLMNEMPVGPSPRNYLDDYPPGFEHNGGLSFGIYLGRLVDPKRTLQPT